jgi:glycosyltransferase involved in cell wall biosynthesis
MTIVIGPYPEAAIGRVPVPGELHVLPTNHLAPAQCGLADWIHPDKAMAERLSAILPHEPPRRVVVFRLYLDGVAALLPAAWRGLAEIDFDDRESATRRSLARLGLRRGRWRLALSNFRGAVAYARLERAALARYACVHLAAPEDVEALRRDAGPAHLVATCNRIADIRPPLAAGPSPTAPLVLFVGTLSYLPNEDAVLWLAKSIAPRLRRLVPRIRVVVVGAAPLALAVRLRRTGIDYLGPLPDLTEVYTAASLAIVPLRGGGGTKIKVLEAWQHHCPVVATRHACRGLGVVPNEHLLQADSAAPRHAKRSFPIRHSQHI